MAKRFFNTSRIEEDWYIGLSLKHRELLRYCESKCDQAGVFPFNAKIASSYIGEKVTEEDLKKLPIIKLANGKYFIVGFLVEQCGKLSQDSPAHKPVFKSIHENNLNSLLDRLPDTLLNRVQEKEKEVEKEVEEEKEEEIKGVIGGNSLHARMSSFFCDQYKQATGLKYDYKPIDGRKIKELIKSIETTVKDKIVDYSEEDVFSTFEILITKLPDWYRKNAFDLKTISGNYSKIIGQLNVKNNGINTADLDRQIAEMYPNGNPYARKGG